MISELTSETHEYASHQGSIVARPGRYYRNTRYVMTIVLILYGGWSLYDGFINWPQWSITHPKEKPYSKTDIALNQLMGIGLPPLGILLLIRCLYLSRGVYRLEDSVLDIPGHPRIPIEAIVAIDQSKWDRKGIAFLDYDLSHSTRAQTTDGQQSTARGRFKLDDFVYDRDPTDEIFRAIEQSLTHRPAVAMQKTTPVPAAQKSPATVQKTAAAQISASAAKPAANQPAANQIEPTGSTTAASKTATSTQPTVSKQTAPKQPAVSTQTSPGKSATPTSAPANTPAAKPAMKPAPQSNPSPNLSPNPAAPTKPPAGVPPKPGGPPPTRMPPRPRMGGR